MTTKSLHSDPSQRLDSLDALRGFDMFWITGGGGLAIALSQLTGMGWLETQMHHVEWAGFRFEDLIFPLFMFISGVAIPFAVRSKIEKNTPRTKMLKKVFQRMLILVLFGIIYNGALRSDLSAGRYASVLGQIGIGYFFAAVIVIYFDSMKSRLIWLGSILAGIGIIQLLIPVPGIGAGILTPEGCINGFIDRMLLPGRMHGGVFDPEGILCSLSATGVTLMGTFAGNILRLKNQTDWGKIKIMVLAGVGSIIVALALSPFYPIIKKCWTSSFNLLTGGIGFLLLSLFYLIIDHWGFKKWAFYFRVIGMNSIFVYMLSRFIDEEEIATFFLGFLKNPLGNSWELFISVAGLAVIWSLLYFMYRKKIFLRV